MTAKAFSPGNVSCIFRVIDNKNPLKKHSLGVGFTVDKGVVVSVSIGKKTSMTFNNKKIKLPTVMSVVKKLTDKPVKVEIKSGVPLGAGFGVTGASAIATAYALNKLLKLGKSKKELAMVAHTAEVENGTGLGDVGGEYNGGFNVKFKRGQPLKGVSLGISGNDIYYKFFSKISTKKIINNENKKKKLNKAGDKALKSIKKLVNNKKTNKKLKFRKIIQISKEFSANSGLMVDKKVKNLIKKIENKGGNASMIMLGNAVFSDIPFPGSKKVKIVSKGAYVL
jgi:pantoate kinase